MNKLKTNKLNQNLNTFGIECSLDTIPDNPDIIDFSMSESTFCMIC